MSVIPTREQSPQIMRVTGGLARPMGPQFSAPRPQGQGGMTGQDILRIIRRRKWLIILSVVIILGVTCVATFLWQKYAPVYTTAAQLWVQPPRSLLRDVYINKDMIEIHKLSLARTITSRPVLEQAVKNTELVGTKWYKKNKEHAVRRLAKEIGVTPVRDTYTIQLSMKGTHPEELPIIVNAVATAFVNYNKNRAVGKQVSQKTKLEYELKDKQNDLQDIVGRSTDEAENPASMLHQLTMLNREQQEFIGEQINLEVAIEATKEALGSLQKRLDKGEAFGIPAVQNAMSMDFGMRTMKIRLEDYHIQMEVQRTRLGPAHKTLLELQQRIEDLKSRISEYEVILVRRVVQGLMGDLQEQMMSDESQLKTITMRQNNTQKKVKKFQIALEQLNKKEAKRLYLIKEINRISSRLTEMELSDIDEVTLDIRAAIPDTIYMPRWSIMIPMGILLGLGFGFGIMFLIEVIDTSIKSPSDIARRIDLPLLGMVPHENDIEEEIEELHLACITHPNSLISEAFRNIRTCLLFSGPASQLRSILVTSPMPGDGRGTVALNLAASIAQSGRKVLVIDANFRQPMIYRTFPDCPEAGLSTALVGQADWKDLVKEVEPNLTVMASGPLPPNPAGLLGSNQMRNLLSEMETQYEQIIFDGPPCLLVTDAPVLSTMVDGVILVVRAGANTHGVVQRSRDVLQRVGAHVLGVVLNGIRVTAGGYLRKNYQSFYEYHEEQLPL